MLNRGEKLKHVDNDRLRTPLLQSGNQHRVLSGANLGALKIIGSYIGLLAADNVGAVRGLVDVVDVLSGQLVHKNLLIGRIVPDELHIIIVGASEGGEEIGQIPHQGAVNGGNLLQSEGGTGGELQVT
ncbi:hypothetical protein SDC9_203810 [bioreactor metagenome]|uniref:Uncharacterized protein n=1 Tax=bioreactor metagenome TaxID=1076179 RepID=A0A645J6M5_9ZZZZ